MIRVFLAALFIAAASQVALAQTTVVRFRQLWDGKAVIPNPWVVITDDRIVDLRVGGSNPAPRARLVDLRDYYGIPGLIDLHTHMTYFWDRAPGSSPLRQGQRLPAVTVFLAQDNAKRTLDTGVTTVRDMSASNQMDVAMRDLIARGAMAGPRMLISGQGLGALLKTTNLASSGSAIADRVASGVDWIKVFASRGSYDSVDMTQTVSFDEMKAIVEAAHAAQKKVAIHSYGPAGVRDAVLAGADSIEHGVDLDDETLREMAKRGTVWVPTIYHNQYYLDSIAEYEFKPESLGPLRDYRDRSVATVRRAVKFGVKIGMGSDAVYSLFGRNTEELRWLVRAGLTPEQALASATTIGAELLGHSSHLGRIAPGYRADIVAVDGDPLRAIDDVIGKVRWVMKDGRVVSDTRVSR
jgi:imidazolonepropionase-like amidohydrolase